MSETAGRPPRSETDIVEFRKKIRDTHLRSIAQKVSMLFRCTVLQRT